MTLVEISVGYDPFHAQVIADVCSDQGIEGELLLFDETRYELGAAAAVANRFLVQADDEPAVRRVIADLYPDMVIEHETWPREVATTKRSPATKAVAAALAAMFLAPVIGGLIWAIRSVFGLLL